MRQSQGRGKEIFKKRNQLQKAVKFLSAAFIVAAAAYFFIGISFDSKFFARDAENKYAKVAGATTLRLRIIDAPGKPIVTVSTDCQNSVPFVNLSWNATSDTNHYDIMRDGEPSVNGLINNSYQDGAVSDEITYSYEVTAVGPATGSTTSDAVNITTRDCSNLPDPAVEIITMNDENTSDYSTTPTITKRNPIFSGTTNMPYAIIQIEISSPIVAFAETMANANGYWSWQVPFQLALGEHTIKITAIDRDYDYRRQLTTFDFNIADASEKAKEEKESEKTKKHAEEKVPSAAQQPVEEIFIPSKMSVSVQNPDKVVYASKELNIKVELKNMGDFPLQNQELLYQIINGKGQVVVETKDSVFIKGNQIIYKNITVPGLLEAGDYKISVLTKYNGVWLNSEDFFKIKELTLINLGGGTITLTGIMENISWTIISLLILLIIFLLLLIVEFRLSKRSLIQITEQILKEQGFLGEERRLNP